MKKMRWMFLTVVTFLIALCGCSASDGVTKGERTETTYTNASIDVFFTKPSGWSFYSREEIDEAVAIAIGMFTEEEETIDNSELIDFFAESTGGRNNIGLEMIDLKAIGEKKATTEELFEEVSKQQTEVLKKLFAISFSKYNRAFMSIISGPWYDGKIGGQNYHIRTTEMNVNVPGYVSQTVLRQHIFMRRKGNHLILIVGTSADYKSATFFANMFSEIQADSIQSESM